MVDIRKKAQSGRSGGEHGWQISQTMRGEGEGKQERRH